MTATKPFNELGLSSTLLSALIELGYESPTSIQEQSIPVLMEGGDLLAQAQTGTGKTAAFALPILSFLDIAIKAPQALVITPTRELAIQVAEAFQSYARHLKGFHVTPIYGGQSYQIQLRALKRGTHVIVGTPGRVMDHLDRGSLSFGSIKTVVLDEADEMLKMGFIDDIEWILDKIPQAHQTALFSATMPTSIQKIAKRYLKDARKIYIKTKTSTVDTIEQFYMRVSRNQKLDALTRFLEVEDIQAALIFARTKTASAELAEKLQARGYAAAALNGDMNQSLRERVIGKIKRGALDIIVATDVAARGIDVERISHVINYDIPYDTELYVHRVGRTGRAGRKGKALLFVTERESRLLKDIERAIRMPIQQIEPPSQKEMNEIRSKQLTEKVMNVIEKSKKLEPYREMVENIMEQGDCDPKDIAAALVYLSQQTKSTPSYEKEDAKPDGERRRRKPSNAKRGSSTWSHGKKKRASNKETSRPHSKKKRSSKEAKKSSGKGKRKIGKESSARTSSKGRVSRK